MVTLLRPAVPMRWRVFGATVAGLLAITLWLRGTAAPPAPPRPPAPTPRSIAVMPFINASPDSSYDYLSAGIGGDLTSALGRVPGLRVAAERSAAALAGDDPVTVGRRLRVGTVLVGSIRPVGDRLRVSAHLVSVDGGFDVWSEAYELPQASFLRVEGDIFRAVAAALRPRDGPAARLGMTPLLRTAPEVHEAYLKARFELGRASPGATRLAAAGFSQAIVLDSGYAPAWAGLAQANLRDFLSESAPPEDVIPLARRAAERALTLDSAMAEARIARAVIWLLYDREPAKAAVELQRAMALNPNLAEAYDSLVAPPADSASAYDSLVAAARDRYVSPYTLAVAAAAASKTGEAVAALARAIAERTPWVSYAPLDPRLDGLHGNRRFEALLARLPQTTIPSRP